MAEVIFYISVVIDAHPCSSALVRNGVILLDRTEAKRFLELLCNPLPNETIGIRISCALLMEFLEDDGRNGFVVVAIIAVVIALVLNLPRK